LLFDDLKTSDVVLDHCTCYAESMIVFLYIKKYIGIVNMFFSIKKYISCWLTSCYPVNFTGLKKA
jgi:hypothetical protein